MHEGPVARITSGDAATPSDGKGDGAVPADRVIRDREVRNTLGIELYQVVVRVGWLFKTETIIMPAVLDTVVDSGLLRGLLPVLNRGGQSVPPLFSAGFVSRRPVKKWLLVGTSLAMAACFALLAVVWSLLQGSPGRLAVAFLVLYGAFAACNGLNQLVAAALQGKLIPPGHRGRAMLVSTVVGSVLAIAAALLLLRPWLAEANGFPKIFAATAFFFALAAAVPLLLDEPPDEPSDSGATTGTTAGGSPVRRGAGDAGPDASRRWRDVLTDDPALVRVSLVAACFSAVIIMFPHYQAFARDRLGTLPASLVTWVVVQNLATGVASLVAGPLSDRRGTKVVLVGLVACSALTPLAVTALSLLPSAVAARWFWLVYVPLGLNPVSLKVFTNYALELAPRQADHATYVSIVGAALAAPFVASPFVGLAVDALGFRLVFVTGALVILAGAIVARGLPEPRWH
ncbi:MAG: MFS transporter [Planctomycetia bacterium]|nr:MFS transporter [Planctomycetia bacterium]